MLKIAGGALRRCFGLYFIKKKSGDNTRKKISTFPLKLNYFLLWLTHWEKLSYLNIKLRTRKGSLEVISSIPLFSRRNAFVQSQSIHKSFLSADYLPMIVLGYVKFTLFHIFDHSDMRKSSFKIPTEKPDRKVLTKARANIDWVH